MLCNGRLTKTSALVLTGDKDRVVPPRASKKIYKQLEKKQNNMYKYVIIPECGHCPHEEKPNDTFEEICEFLEDFDMALSLGDSNIV